MKKLKDPRPQINITPDMTTSITCPCGHHLFYRRFKLAHLSKLRSPVGHAMYVPTTIWVCEKCEHEMPSAERYGEERR